MIVQNKKILTTTFAFFISVVCAVAQNQAPPQPQFATQGTPPPGLPIDDGLIFLFAVALIYGVYIVLRLSKKSTQA